MQLVHKTSEKRGKRRKVVQTDYVHVPKPRILRNDLRRSYGHMMANILNSLDFPLLYGFLDTCFVPNFIHHGANVTGGTRPVTLTGKSDVAQYWMFIMLMVPDAVVSLKEVKVNLKSDTEEMKIVSQFAWSATMIHEQIQPPACIVPEEGDSDSTSCGISNKVMKVNHTNQSDEHEVCDGDSTSGLYNSPTTNEVVLQEIRQLTDSFHRLQTDSSVGLQPLLPQPIKMYYEGTLTMYTDANI